MTATPHNDAADRTDDRTVPAATRSVPACLARTAVFRRLPLAVRNELDEAILLRPPESPTLPAIHKKLQLAERYGLSLASLKTYAARLDRLVRPALASQIVAGVLGCLPDDHRRRLVAGGQVMLLSRVLNVLTSDDAATLPIADLGRLATILASIARRSRASDATCPHKSAKQTQSHLDADPTNLDPDTLARAVHTLYGLPWPLPARDEAVLARDDPEVQSDVSR